MNTYVDKRTHLCYTIDNMTKKSLIFYLINIIIPLCLGCAIYICTREQTYINQFFHLSLHIRKNIFTYILSFYIADFMWAYSLFFTLKTLWSTSTSAILAIGFGTIWEILQLSLIKGTFDFLDILTYIIAIIIAIIILNFWRKKQ